MKIEIAEPGRMTQTGSSLLRLIQNNNMLVYYFLIDNFCSNGIVSLLDRLKLSCDIIHVAVFALHSFYNPDGNILKILA